LGSGLASGPRARRAGRRLCIALTGLTAFVAVTSCASPKQITIVPGAGLSLLTPPAPTPANPKAAAIVELAQLQPTLSSPAPPYTPPQFGTTPTVVTGSHCNSRDYVFERDMVNVTVQAGSNCAVTSGALFDHYTGVWLYYVNDGSTVHAVAIDYVVALSDAWASGAWAWSSAQRAEFGNDPEELVAASTAAIVAKADRGPEQWLPPDVADRCNYVAKQIAIKSAYLLTVSDVQRSALTAVLDSCPDTFSYPRPTTSPPPMPTPSPIKKARVTATPTTKPSASKTP
jgi:hypothetical protein